MDTVKIEPLDIFDERAQLELGKVGAVDHYIEEFNDQMLMLFALTLDGERVGSILLRIDVTIPGIKFSKKLVIVAAYGMAKCSLIPGGLDFIEHCARRHGCDTVKVETRRVGLVKKLLDRNPASNTIVEWRL